MAFQTLWNVDLIREHWPRVLAITCIAGFLFMAVRSYEPHHEEGYTPQKFDKQEKAFQRTTLITKAPGVNIAIRKPITFWTVRVPLTPFRAPLYPFQATTTLPSFVLYRPSVISPPQNQGYCGCCWAFAATGVLADRLAIQTHGRFASPLSVQQVLECYKRNGCNGGSPEECCLFLSRQQIGLNPASVAPYRQTSGNDVVDACAIDTDAPQVFVDGVFSIAQFIPERGYDPHILAQNVQNMKQELAQRGPFYCAMTVYDDLFTFPGHAPYTTTQTQSTGGHAIEVIGYCDPGIDRRPGYVDGYWICKNSWGAWPLGSTTQGYFSIRMGVNMAGIESRCGFAHPQLRGFTSGGNAAVDLDAVRWTQLNAAAVATY